MSLQGDLGRISLVDVPDLDHVITRCRGENLRGCRVEDDLSDFSM